MYMSYLTASGADIKRSCGFKNEARMLGGRGGGWYRKKNVNPEREK